VTTSDDEDWQRLTDGLRCGDEQVLREFYDRYFRVLCGIADRQLLTALRRRFDAEDVVQSALRTFFRRTSIGQFELEDSDRLWRLLCAVTLNKVREKARHHLRKRRGIDQEQQVQTGDETAGANGGVEPAAREPSPAEAAEFADQFQQILSSLDGEEQQVVDFKLQDCTNDEVAHRMGVSERTVRRILKRIESRLERAFAL
jgi:RNA polymerase sigma-70 factor (ECF subfamily)